MSAPSNAFAADLLSAYLGAGTFYAIATTTAASDAAVEAFDDLADVLAALTEAAGTGYARTDVGAWTVVEGASGATATLDELIYTSPTGWDLGQVHIFKQAGGAPATTDRHIASYAPASGWPYTTSGTTTAVVFPADLVELAIP